MAAPRRGTSPSGHGRRTTALYRYPELVEERQVRRLVRAAGDAEGKLIRLLPASAVALIENPPESRGVLQAILAQGLGDPVP
jgi:hypothetical protein